MRVAFHKELEALDQDVVRMGAVVERSTEDATRALVECDAGLARRVREGDEEIDRLFLDIEKRSLTLLAQQAPVAGDLRLIVAILRVVNDLERSGDLAYNIAKLVELEGVCDPGPKAVRLLVSELGQAAKELIGKAIDACATKDQALAADLARQDDRIDELHAQLIHKLLELNDRASVGPAIRLAMVGRYFERIGDHAVNMRERVLYYVTGDEEHLG
jgi:phosphate transport system protein